VVMWLVVLSLQQHHVAWFVLSQSADTCAPPTVPQQQVGRLQVFVKKDILFVSKTKKAGFVRYSEPP